jgi:hypothetical protein
MGVPLLVGVLTIAYVKLAIVLSEISPGVFEKSKIKEAL